MATGARVLIVEDDRDLADNLAEVLDGQGVETVIVDSAEAALTTLENSSFDGVLTDNRLPGLAGVDLVAELRRRGLEMPVVMMSAFMDERSVARAETLGALAVLSKPVDLVRMLSLIAEFSRTGRRVLVVEDNRELSENLAEALRARGFEPVVGDSAAAALRQRVLPKVALVDLRLPDMSGLEVAQRLAARDPQVLVIFVTAFDRELRQAMREGAIDIGSRHAVQCVTKPFDMEELVRRVEDLSQDA